jgi:hypothetical protein
MMLNNSILGRLSTRIAGMVIGQIEPNGERRQKKR